MLIGHPRQKVYLAVGATDLRKAVDGLAAIVQLDFELSPFEPYLFAFCNRMRNKVKIEDVPIAVEIEVAVPYPVMG
jgi:transposase